MPLLRVLTRIYISSLALINRQNVKLEPVDLSGKKKSSSSRTPTKTKEELNLDEKIDDQTRYIDKEGQLKEIVKMSIGSIVGKLENKKRWIVLKGYRLFIYKDEKVCGFPPSFSCRSLRLDTIFIRGKKPH